MKKIYVVWRPKYRCKETTKTQDNKGTEANML